MVTGASVIYGKAEKAGTAQLGQEKARGSYQCVHKYLTWCVAGGGVKKTEPASSQWCPVAGSGHKSRYTKFQLNIRSFFYCLDGQVPAQVAQ